MTVVVAGKVVVASLVVVVVGSDVVVAEIRGKYEARSYLQNL